MSVYKTIGVFVLFHALPTLMIGFFVVIPGSCFAGMNEFTLGFVVAVFGPLPLFIALSRPKVCNGKGNLFLCINKYINKQASHPKGVFGFFLGLLWRSQSNKVNNIALNYLELAFHDRVLEIGFGTGLTIKKILKQSPEAQVTGLEVSKLMIEMASRNNRCALAKQRLHLELTDGEIPKDLPIFDKILSVHNLYFWPDVSETIHQLSRHLNKNGKLLLVAVVNDNGIPTRFNELPYRFYKEHEIVSLMKSAGLSVQVKSHIEINPDIRWFIGCKP